MMLSMELCNGHVAHFQLDDEGHVEIFRMDEITDFNYRGRLLYPSLKEVLDMIEDLLYPSLGEVLDKTGALTDREKAIFDGIFKEV